MSLCGSNSSKLYTRIISSHLCRFKLLAITFTVDVVVHKRWNHFVLWKGVHFWLHRLNVFIRTYGGRGVSRSRAVSVDMTRLGSRGGGFSHWSGKCVHVEDLTVWGIPPGVRNGLPSVVFHLGTNRCFWTSLLSESFWFTSIHHPLVF